MDQYFQKEGFYAGERLKGKNTPRTGVRGVGELMVRGQSAILNPMLFMRSAKASPLFSLKAWLMTCS